MQIKTQRGSPNDKALERVRQFFLVLQELAGEWISLGSTKTGVVYRLKGNPPQSHESKGTVTARGG